VRAIKKSSSCSASDNLPEAEIQDGRDNPSLMKAMNAEIVARKTLWLEQFDQNQQTGVNPILSQNFPRLYEVKD
jgi:hypothetical protein